MFRFVLGWFAFCLSCLLGCVGMVYCELRFAIVLWGVRVLLRAGLCVACGTGLWELLVLIL